MGAMSFPMQARIAQQSVHGLEVVLDERPAAARAAVDTSEALRRREGNGNGRISCSEARRPGIAPVVAEHPAYPLMRDRDGDRTVCE